MAMPDGAELGPPETRGVHTVAECDEVLARGCRPAVADAWLDERLLAMDLSTAGDALTGEKVPA